MQLIASFTDKYLHSYFSYFNNIDININGANRVKNTLKSLIT